MHFSRGANSGEILFYQLETKKNTFQISNSVSPRSPFTPLPSLMQTRIIMYKYCKPRSFLIKLTRLPQKPGLCKRNPNFRLWIHHVKVSALAPTAIIQKLLGIGLRLHCPYVCSFGFAIILQLYNTMPHCSFYVMFSCHVFSFVDGLLLSYYILS